MKTGAASYCGAVAACRGVMKWRRKQCFVVRLLWSTAAPYEAARCAMKRTCGAWSEAWRLHVFFALESRQKKWSGWIFLNGNRLYPQKFADYHKMLTASCCSEIISKWPPKKTENNFEAGIRSDFSATNRKRCNFRCGTATRLLRRWTEFISLFVLSFDFQDQTEE